MRMYWRVVGLVGFAFGLLAAFQYIAHADEVEIPFAVNVREFKKAAKEKGLDLYDQKDSDGFIKNNGQNFTVCTYRRITPEELGIIQDLVWQNMRQPNGEHQPSKS